MKLTATFKFTQAQDNTLVLGVYQTADKDKAPTCAREEFNEFLKKLNTSDAFRAKKGQLCFVRALDDASPNLLFAGLGKTEEVTSEALRILGANIAKRLEAEKCTAAELDVNTFLNKKSKTITIERVSHNLGQGALFSQYSFDLYKSEKHTFTMKSLTFVNEDKRSQKALQKALEIAHDENDAMKIARDLSNEPSSHLYPMELAKRAQQFAKDYGLSCKILDEKQLEKEKMGGLLGVGQGSVRKPCLIVLEYKPKKKARKTIALVGKAVTFDTGGISLKPGAGMEDMKHDMSGGANVIAAICLAAKLKSENHIVCIVAAAENMPDGNAICPSAILHTRSGKTIEVINTDAEGRLILCDALDYAQDYKPDAIVDVATLTGAVVLALSHVAAGIMGNDDKLIAKFKAAAAITEERFVELPIFPEYAEDMKSKIADIRNLGSREAGSQKGGAFLREFIRKDMKWMHVDIAGTAWNAGKVAYHPAHGASGHSLRTLAQFVMDYK